MRKTFDFNIQKSDRKKLVEAIADYLEEDAVYQDAPGFAYRIGDAVVDKEGIVTMEFEDDAFIAPFLGYLTNQGFVAAFADDADNPEEVTGISIQLPARDLTETQINNLKTLLNTKGQLIRKALNVDSLPIEVIDGRLDFPWFSSACTPAEMQTYMKFITALADMAKTQKRVNATDRTIENEKYAFRCFLLRLGFIGNEYKEDRKILLRNLSGSTAFKAPRMEASA